MKKYKIPMRTCVITRQVYPKQELTRIVVNKAGEVFVDESGKLNGRGAYIKLTKENLALEQKKHLLSKELKVAIPEQIYAKLLELLDE